MELLSVIEIIARLRPTHAPIHGRNRWPPTNGTRSCSMIWPTPATLAAPPWKLDMAPNKTGASTMPTRLDAVAEQMAAAMFPPAIDVRAIEDCTVDGRAQRNRTPTQSECGSAFGNKAIKHKPMTGNSANVVEAIRK